MDGLTPQDDTSDDLTLLRVAWVNEKTCPEILMHNEGLVKRLLENVQRREQELTQMTQVEADDNITRDTIMSIMWMDVNRTKFLLRAYLRTRLLKIEAHALHILGNEEMYKARMTELEVKYATEYAYLLDAHFHEAVLNDMPEPYNSVAEQITDSSAEGANQKLDMVPEPNLDTHVFCRVVRDIGNIEIERDTVDLVKDELLVIRYKLIRSLLEDQAVLLI